MSASRAKTIRNEATVNENALAGHVEDAAGMCSLVTRVGRITVNPETKYSYIVSNGPQCVRYCLTVSTWAMDIENTKPISDHIDPKTSGICLPSLSSLASSDSSTAGASRSRLIFSFSRGSSVMGAVISSRSAVAGRASGGCIKATPLGFATSSTVEELFQLLDKWGTPPSTWDPPSEVWEIWSGMTMT